MNWFVLMVLVGLSMPAHATELLRLEAHWKAVDGWQYCGKPVSGLLKVKGPAYVKRVSYEDPYTPLNFITWDPVSLARVTKEGVPRNDNPNVVDIYGKLFQTGKKIRDLTTGIPLRREQLWHFTANEVYYYNVWINSPCVRQSGGGQQRQDVIVIFKTQAGPDHIAESDIPPFKTPQPKPDDKTAIVKMGPLAGQWRITANGYPGMIDFTQSGGSWTGRENIDGVWKPIQDIVFDSGSGHVAFTRPQAAQRYTGKLSTKGMTGTFDQGGVGKYVWGATREVEPSDGTAKSDDKTAIVAMGPLAGQWRITANGYPGMIEFAQSVGSWTGRENIDGVWKPIQDIVFDSGSGYVAFTRPQAAQRYTGKLSTKGMTGTFDQGGVGKYVWGATR